MLKTKDYQLSPEEAVQAEKIGRARCGAKDESIRYNDSGYHSGNADRAFPHIIGAKAEIAYAALTNQKVDTTLFTHHGDNSDFELVEIKSSTWNGDDIELKVKVSEFNRKKPGLYIQHYFFHF